MTIAAMALLDGVSRGRVKQTVINGIMRTAILTVFAFTAAVAPGCTCQDIAGAPTAAAITSPYSDGFDRAELGPDWLATDVHAYRIEHGELVVKDGHNHPLWLKRPI